MTMVLNAVSVTQQYPEQLCTKKTAKAEALAEPEVGKPQQGG